MHQRFTTLMSLQLDGVASQSEQLELGRHLAECPECAAIWEQWQGLDRLLSAAPSAIPSSSLVLNPSLIIVDVEAPPGAASVGCCLPRCFWRCSAWSGAVWQWSSCFGWAGTICQRWEGQWRRLSGHWGGFAVPRPGALASPIALAAIDLTLLIVLCITVVGGFLVLMNSSKERSH